MTTFYNRTAGQSLERLAALSEIRSTTQRRIVFYQALYAVAVLLSVINTYVSIVLLILMQLNSSIAPRVGWLDRF